MDSAREPIVQRVVNSLETMSEGAGYCYDYKGTSRWRLTPPPSAGWPHLTVLDDSEEQDEQTVQRIWRRLRIAVGGWHLVQSSKSDEPARAGTRMISDIERRLLADRTWGGLAVDTMLIDNNLDVTEAGKPNVLCQVRAEIRYRTTENDSIQAV